MKELESIVADAIRGMAEDGRLKAAIEKRIEATLDQILGDVLGKYTPFAEALKETVRSSLAIDPSELGLAGYNRVVLGVVRAKLDAAVEKYGREKLGKDMDELLGDAAPKEIKLSELVREFKEYANDGPGSSARDRCTIIFERSNYGSRWLYLDKEPGKTQYRCQFAMLMGEKGGKVIFSKIGGVEFGKDLFVGPLRGFGKRLFQMYAAGTEVVIDTEDFDDYLPDDSD